MLLGRSQDLLGRSWGALGRLLAALGYLLAALGYLLGRSWPLMAALGPLLGLSSATFATNLPQNPITYPLHVRNPSSKAPFCKLCSTLDLAKTFLGSHICDSFGRSRLQLR